VNTAGQQPAAPVKRFVVFASDDHYPAGGWGDFRASLDTYAEALAVAMVYDRDGLSWHIIDLTTGQEATT